MALLLGKKNKFIKTVTFTASIFALASCFSGCKTTEKQEDVEEQDTSDYVTPVDLNPIALLTEDASIYSRVPVQEHLGLTKAVLKETIPYLNDKDANFITNHLDIVWMGQGTVEDRSKSDYVVTGVVPSIAIKAAFTESKGWSKTHYTAPTTEKNKSLGYNNEFDYYGHWQTNLNLCLMEKNLLGISQDINEMLDKCASHPVLVENQKNKWISQESNDILFFITRPGQYLRSLIGPTVNVSTDYIYGNYHLISGEKYLMSFNMHIKNTQTIPALMSMLKIAFGLTGGTVTQVDAETVRVADIPFAQSQIVDSITRDPITGKHYSVVDDQVIEENAK